MAWSRWVLIHKLPSVFCYSSWKLVTQRGPWYHRCVSELWTARLWIIIPMTNLIIHRPIWSFIDQWKWSLWQHVILIEMCQYVVLHTAIGPAVNSFDSEHKTPKSLIIWYALDDAKRRFNAHFITIGCHLLALPGALCWLSCRAFSSCSQKSLPKKSGGKVVWMLVWQLFLNKLDEALWNVIPANIHNFS